MLVVDIRHWLDERGQLPMGHASFRRRALRVAQIIEYGGPLAPMHARETLLACPKRPRGKLCPGLVWVVKTEDTKIHAFCPACHADEALVSGWEGTVWAEGPMDPVPVEVVQPN